MSIDSKESSAPLRGKSAAVACSPEKSHKLLDGLRRMGATVKPLSVIAIKEMEDKTALDAALSRINGYAWIIFTSSYGALFFVRRMRECGLAEDLSRLRNVCAVGPATAATLKQCGVEVSLTPGEFVAEGVLRALADRHGGLQGLAGARILFPRAKEARDVLPRELAAAGVEVEIVPCYETVPGKVDPEVLRSIRTHAPDLLVFTSSSTVHNFVNILGNETGTKLLHEATVAALGPITAGTVESFGKKPEILPPENTIPSLLEAIRDFFTLNSAQRRRDH